MRDEIRGWFDQEDLKIVADMEGLLLDSANGMNPSIPEVITTMYTGELDEECIATHLKMHPDVIQQYNGTSGFVIKKVTSIRTISDVFYFTGVKLLLSQVHTLIQLFLTPFQSQLLLQRGHFLHLRLKTYL